MKSYNEKGEKWCSVLKIYMPLISFGLDKSEVNGLAWVSNEGRKQLRDNKIINKMSKCKEMLRGAKTRSKANNIEFNLDLAFIISLAVSDFCPVLRTLFSWNTRKGYKDSRHTPSLDRIDNSRGYTKDNVWIISLKANMSKTDMSISELQSYCKVLYNKTLEVSI